MYGLKTIMTAQGFSAQQQKMMLDLLYLTGRTQAAALVPSMIRHGFDKDVINQAVYLISVESFIKQCDFNDDQLVAVKEFKESGSTFLTGTHSEILNKTKDWLISLLKEISTLDAKAQSEYEINLNYYLNEFYPQMFTAQKTQYSKIYFPYTSETEFIHQRKSALEFKKVLNVAASSDQVIAPIKIIGIEPYDFILMPGINEPNENYFNDPARQYDLNAEELGHDERQIINYFTQITPQVRQGFLVVVQQSHFELAKEQVKKFLSDNLTIEVICRPTLKNLTDRMIWQLNNPKPTPTLAKETEVNPNSNNHTENNASRSLLNSPVTKFGISNREALPSTPKNQLTSPQENVSHTNRF